MLNRRLAALLLVLVLALAGCGGEEVSATASAASPAAADVADSGAEGEESEDAIAVRALPVVVGAMSATYSTSATLRAEKVATVTSRTRGVIEQLMREEGDWVAKGEVLAILEDDEQRIEFERASTTRQTKTREYERALELHQQGLMSDEAFDTTQREAEETRHDAELLELRLSRTSIRAPFAGRILVRHLDVGGTVTDGTAVYELADIDPLYADVNVPERQLSRLSVGQIVRLAADSAEATTEAVIERVAPRVDAATGTVKITLAVHGSHDLRPGSFVQVRIVTDTHPRALVVPRSALVAEGRRWHLFRVGEGNLVQRIEIRRGFEEGDRVEILDADEADPPFVAGDRVVVVGARALTDGSRVDIASPEEQQAGDLPDAVDSDEKGDGARDTAVHRGRSVAVTGDRHEGVRVTA
jgi:membrane fusion protein (multidrug efflux system)